jgi:hypothetical protein
MSLNGKTEKASIGSYEVLEARTAKPMAMLTNTPEKSPTITVNNYGKEARTIWPFLRRCPCWLRSCEAFMRSWPSRRDRKLLQGFTSRVVEKRVLDANTTGEEKAIPMHGRKRGIMSGTSYEGVIRLKSYDADLVE